MTPEPARRLHLAVVPHNPVLPLDNGGKIRNFHLFHALAKRHRVSLLMTQPPPEPQLQELRDAGMSPISLPKPGLRHATYLRNLAHGVPVDFAVQGNPSVAGWLRRHSGEIDLILVGSIGPTVNVPRNLGVPLVVDTHNIEWARRASDIATEADPRRRLRRRVMGAGTGRFERRVLRACDRVYVCSADEEAMLRAVGIDQVVVVPNGVDLEGIRPRPEPPEGDVVLFPGDLGYPPNIVASNWIADEIAGAIRARTDRCRLVVAGRDASPELRARLAAADVQVRSPVADMGEMLAESSIVLVPLKGGGGTRLKILEAFGAGRAVVSTRLGAEGIRAEHGRHLLIADTPRGDRRRRGRPAGGSRSAPGAGGGGAAPRRGALRLGRHRRRHGRRPRGAGHRRPLPGRCRGDGRPAEERGVTEFLGDYIVVEWSGGGGIGHYSFLLTDALARAGLPAVLATREGHELEGRLPQAGRIASLWRRAPRRLSGKLRMAFIALTWALGWLRVVGMALRGRAMGRPVIVHVQAPESTAELVFLAILRVVSHRLVITAHNAVPHDSPGIGRMLHRATYRLPHLIITQTPGEAEVVRRLAGRGAHIGVVAHGTYGPIADAFPSPAQVAGDGGTRVAHLGSLRPYKGFDTVVAVVRPGPDRRLLAAPARGWPRLRRGGGARAAGPAPPDAVSFDLRYLTIDELVGEARAADVLLLGHRRASESGILHLALAAGTPVVGPDIAGIGRLLAGRSEWLYPPADVDAAAEAIACVLRETRADRAGTRAAARAIADDSAPSWDAVAAQHLALLKET